MTAREQAIVDAIEAVPIIPSAESAAELAAAFAGDAQLFHLFLDDPDSVEFPADRQQRVRSQSAALSWFVVLRLYVKLYPGPFAELVAGASAAAA